MFMNIGFIGLGLMGNPMAKNILKKNFSLAVYNRTPVKTKELQKLGASVVKSPAELAKISDVIITMVTAGKDVEKILFSKNGVLEGTKKGLIVIDMSTIGLTYAKKIAEKLEKHGIEFLDAPVTGSTPKAITGELTIFVGGKKEVFEKVKPVLYAMGTTLCYMGTYGSGQAIKLINNHIIAANTIALSEAMLLADTMGLSRKITAQVLNTVPAISPYMQMKMPNYVSNNFPLFFSVANMAKDITLARSETKKSQNHFPVLTTTEKLYKKAAKKNIKNEDMSIIIKVLEK